MSRKFYACQCMFKKGYDAVSMNFGKTIYVFKTIVERNEFLSKKANKNEFFSISQKEAFHVTDLNKKSSVPCVYRHPHFANMFVLADIKQCYGDVYTPLKEFA